MALRGVMSWRGLCAGLMIAALAGVVPAAVQAAPDLAFSGQRFGAAVSGVTPVPSQIKIDASVTDAAGNSYVAGTFLPTVAGAALTIGEKADGSPLTLASPSDAGIGFVARFDRNGKAVWGNSFENNYTAGGTPNYAITGIAIETASPPNVYVTAQLTGATVGILPSTTLTRAGTVDSFLMKIPAAGGAPSLVAQYGAAGFEVKVNGVAVDTSGTILIGGSIKGTTSGTYASNIRFGGDPSVRDGFIAKLDNSYQVRRDETHDGGFRWAGNSDSKDGERIGVRHGCTDRAARRL